VLSLSTLALFAMTTVLFQSFSARRAELGRQFALSGQKALSQGSSEQAVRDLRLSLSYAPDEAGNRLLLAEALAQAHHPDEARTYFLGMLDRQPADGLLNLQLARVARQRKDPQAAIAYYRAAAVGNWDGDSLDERFRAQFELADYLAELGDLRSARAELLVAAADAPDDVTVTVMIGQRLEQASDPTDALKLYKKALTLDPKDAEALDGARRARDEIRQASPAEGTPQ
jgi:tetratricopeptide (TPR) repeat protein